MRLTDGQTDRQTERASQYHALHSMQLHVKNYSVSYCALASVFAVSVCIT